MPLRSPAGLPSLEGSCQQRSYARLCVATRRVSAGHHSKSKVPKVNRHRTAVARTTPECNRQRRHDQDEQRFFEQLFADLEPIAARIEAGELNDRSELRTAIDRNFESMVAWMRSYDIERDDEETERCEREGETPENPYRDENSVRICERLNAIAEKLPREVADRISALATDDERLRLAAMAEDEVEYLCRQIKRVYRKDQANFETRASWCASDPVEEALGGQLLKIYLFLRGRSHFTSYGTLLEYEDLWRNSREADDGTVHRALKRLQDALTAIGLGTTLHISHTTRRVKLD